MYQKFIVFRSKEKMRLRKRLSIVSVSSVLAGIGTALGNFFVEGKTNKTRLLLVGLTEVTIGIVSGLIAYNKTYYFKGTKKNWKFQI